MGEWGNKAEYMRQRRAAGGDALKAHERGVKEAYRETDRGRELRRVEYRNRYANGVGIVTATDGEFIGVDGEGGDRDGRHSYLLLRAGDRIVETGSPLGWEDCLEFLSDLDPRKLYVGYFFDYDVSMICASMDPYKIKRLLDRKARFTPGYFTPLPVDVGDYEIDYIKGKFFKVRRATPKGEENLPWVEISDVGRFFQQSFVKTLQDWNVTNDDELEQIIAGKDARAEFGQMTDDIRVYNELECDLLVRLMNKFRATCKTIGVLPRKWQGPGDIATALLQYHRIPKKDKLEIWQNEEFKKAVDATYYGGRFETSAVGRIPGPVYAADINSAYPYALTQVPCVVHGKWVQTKRRPKGDLYIAVGSHTANHECGYFGLPFRNRNGGVSFPAENGVGSYWSFEIKASIHQDFEIADSWSYIRECDCTPFGFIPDLYQKRLRMKKDTQGKVLKLSLNSLYGKCAQRIGSAPYNNYVWGSFITAYTRTMLQNFIHSLPSCKAGHCGENVWMLATDGIYTSELPTDFRSSDELGGWDLKHYSDGIFIVQPGLYYDNAGHTVKDRLAKTRGVPANLAVEYEPALRAEFDALWQTMDPKAHHVEVPLNSFIGLRAGIHRKDPGLIGQWKTAPRKISFDWTGKRVLTPEQGTGFLRTFPRRGSLLEVSRAYDQELARELDARQLGLENWGPDWAPVLGSVQEDV